MKIYIAGALSSKEKNNRTPSKVVTDYLQNVSAMCKVASAVRKKGHYPYVPAMDFILGMVNGDWGEDDYRELGYEFLKVCDAVLVISDSWGVQQEIALAQSQGIPIYYHIEGIP